MTYTEEYLEYLKKHKGAVQKAYRLLLKHKIVSLDTETAALIASHDDSKYDGAEFTAYLNKFYNKDKYDEIEFKKAWLHHIHNNPHHPQYWCLQEDNRPGYLEALDMPEKYIIEMICDWWSFSIIDKDEHNILKWYDTKGKYHIVSDKTRKRVEHILDKIKELKF